ncbi:hypothetical protein [Planctomycetes bacterium K23_9]
MLPSISLKLSPLFRSQASISLAFAIAASLVSFADAVEVRVTAATGQPFGVATIELPVAAPIAGQSPAPLQVSDDDGRVMFPIANDIRVKVAPPSRRPVPRPGNGRLLGRLGNLIREITDGEPDIHKTVARRVTFLVAGDQPLKVRLSESNVEIGVYEIVPANDPPVATKLMNEWWASFGAAAKRQIDSADYPPWVENYLVAMLSAQSGQPLPDWYVGDEQEDDDQVIGTLKLLFGTEAVGETIFRRAAAGDFKSDQTADLPLPAGPLWKKSEYPPLQAGTPIEPIAGRVPPECFYLRFGQFANYLWFRDLSDEYGGDLSRMITLRGINDEASLRVENQLNMKMNQLTRMLGPTVIDDQVIFGRDLFVSDGASIGVILKAKNVYLLKTSINNDRSNAVTADPAVTLSDVTIAGKPVTLLSKTDNTVRSFMAVDDDYICISNSKTLVRRFLEVGETKESLANTDAFQLSRQLMPVDRADTVFAYFSPEMIQGLIAPEYLIELRRRLHAKSDIALVHLAQTAAASANRSTQGVDQLIDSGFLPVGFGVRPDGSGVIAAGDQVIDTRRGLRGCFLPIADVELTFVTSEESQWYGKIAAEYTERFAQIDPIMIGVQREDVAGDPSVERLIIHAEIAPLSIEKYGEIGKQLGPPTRVAMKFAPDDIVAVQAHVASKQIGPPTHLFAGIKDTVPPNPEQFDGVISSYRALQTLPGYLGAWPQPGAIDRLPLGLGRGRVVGPGMTRLLGGLYRFTDEGFSIVSFQPDVLHASLPFIEAVEVDNLATVRLRVEDLTGSKVEGWVNEQLYRRAAASSSAGANFLNLLTRQLKVDPVAAMDVTANILGSDLQCALGGQYSYSQDHGRWVSSAWKGSLPSQSMPAGYIAPAMKWFRGAEATLIQYADRLVADAAVTLKRQGR